MHDVTLRLESIRDDQRDKYWNHLQGRVRMGKQERAGAAGLMGKRPFVKEVVGVNHAGRPVKRAIQGKKCYLDARGTGARGVHYHWHLRDGGCYQIQEQVSRTRARRYYAIAVAGELHEVTEADAVAYVQSGRLIDMKITLPKPEIGDACNGCGLCCKIRVCSAGAYVMGLADRYGDRVDGPCPALVPRDDGGFDCGIMRRPTDHIRNGRGATVLRKAFGILIGAGAGCDEAGDESDETALPKLDRVKALYMERHGIEAIRAAMRAVFEDQR